MVYSVWVVMCVHLSWLPAVCACLKVSRTIAHDMAAQSLCARVLGLLSGHSLARHIIPE
jgi:hypothetical protein